MLVMVTPGSLLTPAVHLGNKIGKSFHSLLSALHQFDQWILRIISSSTSIISITYRHFNTTFEANFSDYLGKKQYEQQLDHDAKSVASCALNDIVQTITVINDNRCVNREDFKIFLLIQIHVILR
jgi:hypothetical protein